MSSSRENSRSSSFFSFLKNLFIILLILQFAPTIISNVKDSVTDALFPKAQVGYMSLSGFIKDATFYTKKLEEFEKSPDIKALLLKIDCPGGLPGSSQSIFNELKKFKKKKPVVALVENMCASAAYYIASAADKIVSNPSSLIGGIGVVMHLPNVKELLDSWKVKFERSSQ